MKRIIYIFIAILILLLGYLFIEYTYIDKINNVGNCKVDSVDKDTEIEEISVNHVISTCQRNIYLPNEYISIESINSLNESPSDKYIVKSPLVIDGLLSGSWCFENNCIVHIKDSKGNILNTTSFNLNGDWMTEKLVPFSLEISYISNTDNGYIIFEKNNPSGLEQNCAFIVIPVIFK